MSDWEGWMLEATDIYPQVCAGWCPYEETLLTATREIEENLALVGETTVFAPFARHATEVRHILVAVKLLCRGVNPYDPALTKGEWIAVANAEVARYPWALDHARLWALNLGYVEDYPLGGVRIVREPAPRPVYNE